MQRTPEIDKIIKIVYKMKHMPEFGHHIGWLRPFEDKLSAGTLTDVERAHAIATCKHVLQQNPASEMATTILEKLRAVVTANTPRIRIETLPATTDVHVLSSRVAVTSDAMRTMEEAPDQLRAVQRAVEQAVAMGIVREEVLPARIATQRRAYLLSSSHYGIHEYDPSATNPDTKATQVELFQLMHLLMQQGFQGPVFVEGRDCTQTYSPFRGQRPTVTLHDGNAYDIHHAATQAALFQNPSLLIALMDTQQRAARIVKASTPIFYQYSAYRNFRGAHTPATEQLVKRFGEQVAWEHSFRAKYAFFFDAMPSVNGQTQLQVESGWDGNGTPLICLGTKWIFAQEFIQDATEYLRYADALHEVNAAREKEMADFFQSTSSATVPMGFAGKAHEFAIAEHATAHMHLHVLTPKSSTHLDHLRRTLPVNDPRCAMLRVDIMQKLLAFAQNIKPRMN